MKTRWVILLFCFSSFLSVGQKTAWEKERIMAGRDFFLKHGIALDAYSFTDTILNLELTKALKHHKASQRSFVVGTVFSALGIISLLSIHEVSDDPLTGAFDGLANAAAGTAGGAAFLCAGISFTVGGSNHKKMKNALRMSKVYLTD